MIDLGTYTRPTGTLIERALSYLDARPVPSEIIAAEVLGIERAPAVVSDRLATALLGADPRVRRLPDGRWDLVRTGRLAPRIEECTFAVVDVETTGSRASYSDRITEIAVVLLHDGRIEVALDTLVNPERPIPRIVTEITNIAAADVRDQPVFAEIADDVVSALSGRVFVAHNVRFDWAFVARSLKRCREVVLDGPRLCTVRLAKRLIPGLRSRGLDSLAHYFGIEIERRHRAGGDALATAMLLQRLLERARERGATTLRDLERMCQRRPVHKKAKRKRKTERSLPSLLDEI